MTRNNVLTKTPTSTKFKLPGLFQTRKVQLILIFLVSFVFRLLLVLYFQPQHFPSDGIGYYNIAVNLIKGNGFSAVTDQPYIPEFSREPAYPFYLSAGLKLYELFGGKSDYLFMDNYSIESSRLITVPGSVVFLRIWQALLDSLAMILLFFILNQVLSVEKSLVIIILYSIFFPVAIHTHILYREVFQNFILLAFNLLIVIYLSKRKWYFTAMAGVLWGISNLTLYATIALFPFIFFFLVYNFRSLKKAIPGILVAFSFMLLSSLPWYVYVYSHYPDVRIFKSGASALTHEWRDYYVTHIKANRMGIISDEELRIFFHSKAYNRPYYEYFEKSFNGYYTRQADSLRFLMKQNADQPSAGSEIGVMARNVLVYSFKNFWIKKDWGYQSPIKNYRLHVNQGEYLPFFLYALSTLIGFLGVVGFFKFWKQLRPILLIFISFLGISVIIGTEARRLLPAYPYVFTFAIMMAGNLLFRVKDKWLIKETV